MMCVGIYAHLPHDNKRRMRSKDRDIKSDGVDCEWTEHVDYFLLFSAIYVDLLCFPLWMDAGLVWTLHN